MTGPTIQRQVVLALAKEVTQHRSRFWDVASLYHCCVVEPWLNTDLEDEGEIHVLQILLFNNSIGECRMNVALHHTAKLEEAGHHAGNMDQNPVPLHAALKVCSVLEVRSFPDSSISFVWLPGGAIEISWIYLPNTDILELLDLG